MPTDFQKKVWAALKKIPRGKVTSYAAIAKFLGNPRAARAVGNAVGKNPNAPKIPCHRVICADGRLGNYSGAGGILTKKNLLKSEKIKIKNGKIADLKKVFFDFPEKKVWFVYLLKCADGSFYAGICTDLARRLFEHNFSKKGAKFTRGRRPVALVFAEKCANRAAASRREMEIKKMKRAEKKIMGKKIL